MANNDPLRPETTTDGGNEVFVTGMSCYQTGWVCPKCGRVYSPSTPMCWYCGDEGNATVMTSGTGTPPGWEKE